MATKLKPEALRPKHKGCSVSFRTRHYKYKGVYHGIVKGRDIAKSSERKDRVLIKNGDVAVYVPVEDILGKVEVEKKAKAKA